ncbi:MAG: adenylate/guanylate cyclase domain-containing protein [Alphaproteobacteria bacterium]
MHRHDWEWSFDAPPEVIWPILSDTARFNEAAGLPKHDITETPQDDGSVLFTAVAKQGPLTLAWREEPVNWIANKWFEHRRHFTRGPLKMLCATLRIEPAGPDGKQSHVHYMLEVEAANLLGELALRTVFFKSTNKTFAALIESTADYARGERDTPFEATPPAFDDATRQRIAQAVEAINATPHAHGLAEQLARHATTGQEVDVVKIRPLALARRWGARPRDVIELCLEATRAGLLDLRWDILCPRCRVAKSISQSLDEMPTGAHCGTCNIDYDRDFSRNVELSFQPAAGIRPVAFGEYCLFGPMSTPHIVAQVCVAAGATRELEAPFTAGRYLVRTLEAGPETDFDFEGGGFPEVQIGDGTVSVGTAVAPGTLRLINKSTHDRNVVVEERAWERDALTADRVTALQTFRDLFSDQLLRPGDEVAIQRVTLMFTDLQGSTALYESIGDARAYGLVRDHFAFLTGIVREHDGAVVKTIGDAVMAAFVEPGQALAAALEIQQAVAEFNRTHAQAAGGDNLIAIKVGIHGGPCIAVTLNDRLDYFGTTVNMTARLEGQSRGGDIIVSTSLAGDPAVAALLAQRKVTEESAELRGFDGRVEFLRIDETTRNMASGDQ